MKKILIFLAVVSLVVSCENDTLDRTATPEGELTRIEVISDGNPTPNIDPETGIELSKVFLTNTDVTFRSTTSLELIQSSLWFIPQPDARSTDTGDITDINITEFNTAAVTVQFLRGNETQIDNERNGFVINLIETLTDGTINTATVQVGIRQPLNPSIVSAPATRGIPTTIQPSPLGVLGLASTDTDTQFIWRIVDDGFFILPDGSLVTEVIVDDYVSTLSPVPVIFTAVDGLGEISLQIIRNFPIPSESEVVNFTIDVFPGFLPNGGEFKDNIKLNSLGNELRILYQGVEINNINDIQPSDYVVNVNTSGSGNTLPDITVNNITSSVIDVVDDDGIPVLDDDGNQLQATELILTLSQKIPPLFMDNVTLGFTNENIVSTTGVPLAFFEGSEALNVVQTGENIMPNSSFDFEDSNVWNGDGFFFPNPPDTSELSFSTEQAYTGSQSFLFDTVGTPLSNFPTNFGIGAAVVATDLPLLESGVEYTFSMMVYVENTDAGSFITAFLLDFAVFNQGAQLSSLATGQWVVINGTRVAGADNRLLIRVVNPDNNTTGNVKVFVDHFDVRVADDGR